MLRDLMILSMSTLLKVIADKLLSELRTTSFGNELLLEYIFIVIGVHFQAKNSLKSLAFSLKLATNLSFSLKLACYLHSMVQLMEKGLIPLSTVKFVGP